MSKIEKLKAIQLESGFSRIDKKKMETILGGNALFLSCNKTGSSSSCDNTAVCNCPSPEEEADA